jgi:hypothetical protein
VLKNGITAVSTPKNVSGPAGKPIYDEFRFLELLGGENPGGYREITVGGRPMFIAGDPAALYRSIRKKAGLKKVWDFLPFEPEAEPHV